LSRFLEERLRKETNAQPSPANIQYQLSPRIVPPPSVCIEL